jgi:hypothetical protein
MRKILAFIAFLIATPALAQVSSSIGPGPVPGVQGPASATSGHIATFNGTTGQIIQDGGAAPTGTVSSVTCGTGLSGGTITATGTCAVIANATFTTGTQLSPTGTSSSTGVMMGMGSTLTITPTNTGRVTFTMQIMVTNGTVATNSLIKGYYGTGTAPANGVALTGTAFTDNFATIFIVTATGAVPITVTRTITGLTPTTPYWFDIALGSNGGTGTSSIKLISASAVEN